MLAVPDLIDMPVDSDQRYSEQIRVGLRQLRNLIGKCAVLDVPEFVKQFFQIGLDR